MITDEEEGAASFIADMFAKNQVAILEVKRKGTEERVLLLCFYNRKGEKKGVDLVPFGEIFQAGFKASEVYDTPDGSVVDSGTKEFFEGLGEEKPAENKDFLNSLN